MHKYYAKSSAAKAPAAQIAAITHDVYPLLNVKRLRTMHMPTYGQHTLMFCCAAAPVFHVNRDTHSTYWLHSLVQEKARAATAMHMRW
eukprot:scaffold227985_cov23-Tisochrysis_lutea.AAC.1